MEPEPVQESLLMFYYHALGIKFVLLLPLSAFVSFVLILLVVIKGKGPAVGAVLMFLVSMPLFTGFLGYIDGMIASHMVIAHSMTMPRPSEVSMGTSMSLVSIVVGLWLSFPGFMAALVGLLIRAFKGT